jgi:hypothetical protein
MWACCKGEDIIYFLHILFSGGVRSSAGHQLKILMSRLSELKPYSSWKSARFTAPSLQIGAGLLSNSS